MSTPRNSDQPAAAGPIGTEGQAIIQRILKLRGHAWPLHYLMAEIDPGFLDLFDESYRYTLGFGTENGESSAAGPATDVGTEAGRIAPGPGIQDASLPVRYRELICACACAIQPAPIEVTVHHLERAFSSGLTEREAMEGFQALLIPSGGIAVSNGARALLQHRANQDEEASNVG